MAGKMRLILVQCCVLWLFLCSWSQAQQIPDPDFDAAVATPAYLNNGPSVAIDEAHANFHTFDGNYKPLAELLRNDGYNVIANDREFAVESLRQIDVLVVANAGAVISEAESDSVRDWVMAGGSLLLIADHAPFGAFAANLAEHFGVTMGKGWVFDAATDGVSTQLTFSTENGLLGTHPITSGRNLSEEVRLVRSFTGQSLGMTQGASVLLQLSDTAREAATTDDLDAEYAARSNDHPEELPGTHSSPAAGRVQGLALSLGEGKVVIFGEAAMFSAQVVTIPGGNGPVTIRAGMNVPGNDNRQFALNVLHWLSGALE